MLSFDVDGLRFSFPDGWQASKYDEWAFYRSQFIRQANHIAAMDAVAVSPTNEAWLIEAKDYRHPNAGKPSDLPGAVFNKVLCTLAAMLPASLRAADHDERQLSHAVVRCTSLRVVLHVEQDRGVIDLADIKQELKRKLKAIDPQVKIVSTANMGGLPWTVTGRQEGNEPQTAA
ncbi:MAG TPA: hypothetical protein VF284_12595 [Rhodanobacteraceae bacterium]